MSFFSPLIARIVKYTLALVYGTLVSLRLLVTIILHPIKAFSKTPRPVPPAVLNDPTLGEHHFITLKGRGVKLHYVANGSSDSPLMLFVHGFPEFWFSWRHQLRKFSRDYRVVAIDMRGYGESDKPRGLSSYVMDELVADLKSLIVELGYSSATMVAHDWGGAIAWRFAMKHPDLLDKLVQCNAPHPTVMAKILRSSMKQFLKSWYIFFFTCPFIPELWCSINDFAAIKKIFTDPPMGCTRKNALTEEDIEAYTYMFQKSGFTGPINYYRANSRFPKREEVEEINNPKMIDVPTLIIWGTADGALEREQATQAAKLVRNCTVKFIEGASHWVQQDQPGLVNAYMMSFLRGEELRHEC